MQIDTNAIMSMTEANQNFSKVARVAEKKGAVLIFKNNRPKYMVVDVENNTYMDLSDDEKIDVAAKRVLNKYRAAFEELAK